MYLSNLQPSAANSHLHVLSARSAGAPVTPPPVPMDDDRLKYSQPLPRGNADMTFDRFWESYDGRLTPSNEAQPLQPAPFFQFSGYGNMQESLTTSPLQKMPFVSQKQNPQARNSEPDMFQTAQWQRGRSSQASRTQPANKRQKTAHPISSSFEILTTQVTDRRGDEESVMGSESECCSSCSDGIPCASPDCAPCSEPGCNSKTIAVIPCNKKACEQPACTDQCLSTAIQVRQAMHEQDIVSRERLMSNLVELPWNPQKPRDTSLMGKDSFDGILDPALNGFDAPDYTPAAVSPAPTTASMRINVPTPYSLNTGMPTAEISGLFSSQHVYRDVLSGTGAMFNSLSQTWPEEEFSRSNDSSGASMFQCTWDGCYQPFQSYNDWLPHLHKNHVDPQMVFGCPIQAEKCPRTISTNPLDHLQIDHGFNFDMNNNFSCPAPNCFPTETFCDPAMLHNHFDHAHATPAQGGLRCRLEKTCDFFGDYDQLFSHINEQHQLPPMPKDEEIDLSLPTSSTLETATRPDCSDCSPEEGVLETETGGAFSADEAVHSCMWKADNQVCGLIFQSEVELQTHLKSSHLESLDKRSGYRCLWEDCKRKEMPLEKQGFSQRGKLERHMATHTNCKQISNCSCTSADHWQLNVLYVMCVVKSFLLHNQ